MSKFTQVNEFVHNIIQSDVNPTLVTLFTVLLTSIWDFFSTPKNN